ncbi:MAG: hypothetical protein A2Y33_15445 [Spirochaetes bacterium GWF1_51_8]|nr:MAG: hypothetical protein A2Y33_15445 [Spirochaetes bacterium GWF1_51_8]
MTLKRILLIVLLVFATASLILIVIFARDKKGIFSKSLESHLSNQTVTVNSTIVSNLSDIGTEVKTLAGEKLVKNVFFSQAMGDDVRQYQPQFEDIRSHIKSCVKIQIVDRSGTVYFSTLENEIITKKIKETLVLEIRKHFLKNKEPYYFFLNKNDFISIFPTFEAPADTDPQGYVLIYYKTDRLLSGISDKSIMIPFSVDNNIVVASKNVDTNTISKIINYYNSDAPQKNKEEMKGKAIGVIWRVMGLKIIHMEKSDFFMPVLAIVFIIINIILIGLIVYALLQTRKEAVSEDYYIPKAFTQKEQYERMSRDFDDEAAPQTRKFNVPNTEEIEDLVDDIEKNETYNGFAAKKGIEDMIMSSSDSLTDLPGYSDEPSTRKPFESEPASSPLTRETFGSSGGMEEEAPQWSQPETETSPKWEVETPTAGIEDEEEWESSETLEAGNEFPSWEAPQAAEGGAEIPEWEAPEVAGTESEIPEWEAPEAKTSEPKFAGFDEMPSTDGENKPTEMFAEQERILGGMEDQGEFSEIPAPEEFSFDQPITESPAENEPVFDMLPEDDHDLIGGTPVEPSAESLVMEVPVSEIEPHMQGISAEEMPASEEIDFGSIQSDEELSQMSNVEDSIVSFDESEFDQAVASSAAEESFPVLDETVPPVVASDETGMSSDFSLTDIGQAQSPEFDLGTEAEFELPPNIEEPEEIILDNYGIQTEPVMNEPMTEEIPDFSLEDTGSEDLSQYEIPDESSNGMAMIDIPANENQPLDQFETPLEPETSPSMEEEIPSFEIPEPGMQFETEAETGDAFGMPEPQAETAPNDEMIEDLTSGMDIPEIDIDSMITGIPDNITDDDDDSITLDPNEMAALDIQLDSETPSEGISVEEPLLGDDFEFNAPEPLPESGDAPLSAQPESGPIQDIELPEGQDIPEFDLDAMINEVPSVDSINDDDDSITLDMDELSAIDLDLEEVHSTDDLGPAATDEASSLEEAPSAIQDIEVRKPIDFNKVFMEPPVKISTIAHVESYADVAMDLAVNNLNFNKISVMKKSGEEFGVLMKQGFSKETSIGLDDPIYQKYLSRKKSVDIRGDLTKSSYLTERFSLEDLQNLEELMIVPVVKGEEIKGIGIYGREKGKKEATHFQKSELYNLGFLQEE